MTKWPVACRRDGPPMPDLSQGRCQPGRSQLPAEAWSADASPAEREAAMHACQACPVLGPCAEWAVTSLPRLDTFGGIVGGMFKGTLEAERKRRRGG